MKYHHTIGEENRTPNAIFNNTELIKIWLTMLLQKYNKRFTIHLTQDEINNEIDEVKSTIENEKIWAEVDSIHESNISSLNAYLNVLYEILKEKEDFELNKELYQDNKIIDDKMEEWSKGINEMTAEEIKEKIDFFRNVLKERTGNDQETILYRKSVNLFLSRLIDILQSKEN